MHAHTVYFLISLLCHSTRTPDRLLKYGLYSYFYTVDNSRWILMKVMPVPKSIYMYIPVVVFACGIFSLKGTVRVEQFFV